MSTLFCETCRQKFLPREEIQKKTAELRHLGKTIATLNGSFDLMHAGHLQIIYEASQQADVLIVALNTDASIKAYKHPDRPIIPLEYRRQMMAALEFVDFVTWFDETDPCRILSEIKPDVHVNGAEYGANCLEAATVAANGGRIHIVPLIPGLSTSQIIKKIISLEKGSSTCD
jgi:rfaE bifunctional protein nucleotidyltransferase chain/domain